MKSLMFFVPLIALSACMAQPEADAPDMNAQCGAPDLQHLVGQPLTAFAGTHPDADAVRVIAPDMAVTMDFRSDRLNVEHDDSRIIRRVYCG